MAVKKNQTRLRDDAAGAFEYGERTRSAAMERDSFETVNKARSIHERHDQ